MDFYENDVNVKLMNTAKQFFEMEPSIAEKLIAIMADISCEEARYWVESYLTMESTKKELEVHKLASKIQQKFESLEANRTR